MSILTDVLSVNTGTSPIDSYSDVLAERSRSVARLRGLMTPKWKRIGAAESGVPGRQRLRLTGVDGWHKTKETGTPR